MGITASPRSRSSSLSPRWAPPSIFAPLFQVVFYWRIRIDAGETSETFEEWLAVGCTWRDCIVTKGQIELFILPRLQDPPQLALSDPDMIILCQWSWWVQQHIIIILCGYDHVILCILSQHSTERTVTRKSPVLVIAWKCLAGYEAATIRYSNQQAAVVRGRRCVSG